MWDPYGEGSDECIPHEICEDEGIIGSCNTEAEQEQHDNEVAWAEYEAEQLDAELASFDADVDQYCNDNPWACEGVSGPSACQGTQHVPGLMLSLRNR